ncbi:serine/threonine-protein kinase [Herbaspirillum robiniae]|uniref:serine/threonine-protein kinase n=1 Tax=Herbaspirillum robiniae TaxID=2014887 RepID=UPI003D772800
MGKIYGGRWEILDGVGTGGQGDVFKVKDISSSSDSGPVALKRVKNPKRHVRFQQEVNAIKTLNHPNVIKLIDHSALNLESDLPEKQFIVMPLARGGDLAKRVSLYKSNLDGVLIVARQLADALKHAHEKGIVHRDVKPQNILFKEESHEVWLTDFGICFLREAVRPTVDGEVVGPWSFMAPELEHGGQLEVTPSADIYSLGKLIYYMISGGNIVPREEMFSPPYSKVFSGKGRYELLELMLRKMVCKVGSRLQHMSEVIQLLDRIISWDQNSTLTPISSQARSKLGALRASILESREIQEKNTATAQSQRETEERIGSHFLGWVKG